MALVVTDLANTINALPDTRINLLILKYECRKTVFRPSLSFFVTVFATHRQSGIFHICCLVMSSLYQTCKQIDPEKSVLSVCFLYLPASVLEISC